MTVSDPTGPALPQPPNKPETYECCDRGCSPCIFDYYWDAIARWGAAVRELGHDPDAVLKAMGRKR